MLSDSSPLDRQYTLLGKTTVWGLSTTYWEGHIQVECKAKLSSILVRRWQMGNLGMGEPAECTHGRLWLRKGAKLYRVSP